MDCFNPRAPCGARQDGGNHVVWYGLFQSTRPMRGATTPGWAWIDPQKVSIHAPHAGRDQSRHSSMPSFLSFNPRAPCGARLGEYKGDYGAQEFQSTRPMRGATYGFVDICIDTKVSIHAPHAGRDLSHVITRVNPYLFQSTRPMRGATHGSIRTPSSSPFQSTRPMRGATRSIW